jgi:hypothetical protein
MPCNGLADMGTINMPLLINLLMASLVSLLIVWLLVSKVPSISIKAALYIVMSKINLAKNSEMELDKKNGSFLKIADIHKAVSNLILLMQ